MGPKQPKPSHHYRSKKERPSGGESKKSKDRGREQGYHLDDGGWWW